MKKIMYWLYNRFLPVWCKESLLKTNEHLNKTVTAQKLEIDRLNAYIDGMHAAMRRQPRIQIYSREVKRE